MESKISIPKPCTQNWNAMTATEKGKFCSVCQKNVIDFRKMKQNEIHKYYEENSKNGQVCGYFNYNQVDTTNKKFEFLKQKINQINIRPLHKIAMAMLGLLFSMSSCMGKQVAEQDPLMGEPTAPISDTISNEQIMGEIEPPIMGGMTEPKISDTIQKNDNEKNN